MSVSLIDGHIDDDAMTDEQIIKALEYCIKGDVCENCPYFTRRQRYECGEHFNKDVLDLINRQKAEIERQRSTNQKCGTCIYAKPYVGEGKTFKSYVECTNEEHLAKYCKYKSSKYRQKTTKACKCYKEQAGENK